MQNVLGLGGRGSECLSGAQRHQDSTFDRQELQCELGRSHVFSRRSWPRRRLYSKLKKWMHDGVLEADSCSREKMQISSRNICWVGACPAISGVPVAAKAVEPGAGILKDVWAERLWPMPGKLSSTENEDRLLDVGGRHSFPVGF